MASYRPHSANMARDVGDGPPPGVRGRNRRDPGYS